MGRWRCYGRWLRRGLVGPRECSEVRGRNGDWVRSLEVRNPEVDLEMILGFVISFPLMQTMQQSPMISSYSSLQYPLSKHSVQPTSSVYPCQKKSERTDRGFFGGMCNLWTLMQVSSP